MDKICIIESHSKKGFVIEPCPAIFFICKMEEIFEYFLSERRKHKTSVLNGGIIISESLFRSSGVRGENELLVSVTFELIENEWQIGFCKLGQPSLLNISLDSFLAGYFDFGKRMIRFYDYILPEYREFDFLYSNFMKSVTESIIMEEFEIISQSGFDDLTYYDYQ